VEPEGLRQQRAPTAPAPRRLGGPSLHVAPVLLGGGTRLFGDAQLTLEPVATVQTPNATHLRFRVAR